MIQTEERTHERMHVHRTAVVITMSRSSQAGSTKINARCKHSSFSQSCRVCTYQTYDKIMFYDKSPSGHATDSFVIKK